MTKHNLKFIVLLAICFIGAQSKELCAKESELENLDADDFPFATPKCTTSVDVLQVGMMIQRYTNRPQSQLIPRWLNMTLLQEGRRFANKNFALLWFSNYIRSIVSVANEEFMPWLPHLDKSASADKVAKTILTSVSETLGALAVDTDTPINMDNLKNILNSIVLETEGQIMSPKKYSKVNLDQLLWAAVENDLQLSSIPKEYRSFSEDMMAVKKWQTPLNQFSLALGQYSLFGIPFSTKNVNALLNASPEEEKGWLHLWAVLGHIIGIEENFNVALQKNKVEATAYYKDLINNYLVPSFFQLKMQQKVLIEALLKVSSALMPAEGLELTPRLNMVIFLEEFLEIETPKTRSLLTVTEKENLQIWQDLKSSLSLNPFILESLNIGIKAEALESYYLSKYIYTQ